VHDEPGAEVSILLLDAVVGEDLPDERAEGLHGREVRHRQPLPDAAHLELKTFLRFDFGSVVAAGETE